MKMVPGTLRNGGASFATTRWSVVAACQPEGDASSAETAAAIEQLCRDYWPPLYSFVRRRGYSPADAQDLVQGFFTHFLHRRLYARSDSEKGKFRTFLLTALKNYLADSWEKGNALKRGGGYRFVFLDFELDAAETLYQAEEMPSGFDEEWLYEQRWATALVSRALAGLRAEFAGEKKSRTFEKLLPFVCSGRALPRQEDVAEELAMPLDTLRSHLSRIRTRYRTLLREEVERTIGSADDVDEELRHLLRILIAQS